MEYDIGVGRVMTREYRDLRKNIAIVVVVVVAEDGVRYCQFLKVSSSVAWRVPHTKRNVSCYYVNVI